MKPGREVALRWLRQAEHDRSIASGHQECGDFSDACFMGEQAAQKTFKAFLIGYGHRSVPIHSVAHLAARCAQIDPAFADHITDGRVLDRYDIPMRYPNVLAPPAVPCESYAQEQGTTAMAAAQAIVALVAHNLRPAKGP